MFIFKKVRYLYYRYFTSPFRYAKYLGVKIGEKCLINTYNWGTEPYLISIGNHVQITHGVSLHTHGGGHCIREKYPDFDVFGKIVIKDWAYVGAFSQIMPGVTIGEGALIAAGSIVTKSVAPHSVVGGNPAKYICSTDDFYHKNEKYNLATKGMSYEEKKDYLLSIDDSLFINK